MDITIQNYVSSILAVAAFILTIYHFFLDKRRLKIETITHNRMEWLKTVRELLGSFMELYNEHAGDIVAKRILSSKIELYMRRCSEYSALLDVLRICVNDAKYEQKNADRLISESQEVLNRVWQKITNEAGIAPPVKPKEDVLTKEESRKIA